MEKPTLNYKVGQSITVEMFRPTQGRMPIGKTAGNIVCFLRLGKKDYIEYNSIWDCDIVEIKKNSLVVTPTYCLRTAKVNQAMIDAEILKAFGHKKEKKVKPHYEYPYTRK